MIQTAEASAGTDHATRPLRRLVHAAPKALVAGGLAMVAVAAPVVLFGGEHAAVVDDLQQALSLVVCVAALLIAAATTRGEARAVALVLAAAGALAGAGFVAWFTTTGSRVTVAGPSAGLFALSIGLFGCVLVWASVHGMDRARRVPVGLQSLIVVAAVATTMTAVWGRFLDPTHADPLRNAALVAAIAIVAGPGGTYLALLDRGIRPGIWGPFALIDGLTLAGIAWLGWQMLVVGGSASSVSPFDPLLSVGVLAIAWAGITWVRRPAATEPFVAFARTASDAFPIAAVTVCLVLNLLVTTEPDRGLVAVGTAIVVALTLARQVLLIRSERRTHLAEQAAARRLSRATAHRGAIVASLGNLAASDSPEATAWDVCNTATGLDGIDWAIIMALDADGLFRVLAERGPVTALPVGHRRSASRSAYLAEHAGQGPWFEAIDDAADEHLVAMRAAGIHRVASAPLLSGERMIGVIRLGGSGDDGEDALNERLIAARELGAVAGALIAPGLERQVASREAREHIERVIADAAFYPVFQPIVELATARVVGFEALTRFADGMRPDLRFEEAALAGLGVELEIATLAAAVREAVALPRGTYVSLNVSSELACHPSGVVAALAGIDRDLVLEVTEHAAVVSYAELRGVLAEFGDHVRIAVDDAGAGFAGLQHILEIDPDLVKLDLALVRGVDADPARRALIGGMVAFARDTGATLLAEGVETEAEATTLRGLGVTLGQGYLYGRPARVVAPGG